MKKPIFLFVCLLMLGLVTAAQKKRSFSAKTTVKVVENDQPVKNTTVTLHVSYHRMGDAKNAFEEIFKVKTNSNGEAVIWRGMGKNKKGDYKKVMKLLADDNNTVMMYVYRQRNGVNDDRWLAVFFPGTNGTRPGPKFVSDTEVNNQ